MVCGKKTSLCCSILSAWGLVQLGVMAGLFYWHSVALFEDIAVNDEALKDANLTEFGKLTDEGFQMSMQSCLVAAAVYLVTLVVSLVSFMRHTRSSLTV